MLCLKKIVSDTSLDENSRRILEECKSLPQATGESLSGGTQTSAFYIATGKGFSINHEPDRGMQFPCK